jgi:hypothetical protein
VSDPVSVSIDLTKPTITAAADRAANSNSADNGTGWYRDDVTVAFTCSDALSGIDGPSGCPAPKTLEEGYDQRAEGTASDVAGNTAGADVSKVNIDKTAPTLAAKPTTEPNAAGWYKGDVRIAWTCGDQLSGLQGACPTERSWTARRGRHGLRDHQRQGRQREDQS